MKRLTTILLGLALLFAACGNTPSESESETDSTLKRKLGNEHNNYVFSLFKNVGKMGYQIYHNNEKFAAFSLEEGRKPLSMRIHSGNCFLLVSGNNNDSVPCPSQIYKNGKPVMSFGNNFKAVDLAISSGHFYVIGYFGDTLISVFKDGLSTLNIHQKGSRPTHICVYDESIYYTLQKGDKTEFYQDKHKMYEIPGECKSFQISKLGKFSYMNGKIYSDDTVYFNSGLQYEFYNKSLAANPEKFSITDSTCFVSSSAVLDGEKSYAAIFQDNEHFITIKPDDMSLGKSENQTVCRGIAACTNGVYYVTENVCPSKDYHENIYHYYFNSEEIFQIEQMDEDAELLMVRGW